MATPDLGIDELLDDLNEMVGGNTSNVTTDSVPTSQRNLGGFQDMSSEEIEQFQNSQEYKEYKANIHEAVDKGPNMHGKTVQDIMGLSNKRDILGYSYNSLEHYDIDIEIYEDIVAQSPVMQQTLEE